MRKLLPVGTWSLLVGSVFVFSSCALLKTKPKVEKPPETPKETGCPSRVEAMGRLDWGLGPKATLKIRNGLIASSQTAELVKNLEEDLVQPCTGLAQLLGVDAKALVPETKDLGAKAEHVCKVATEAFGALRTKAGGTLSVELSPRDCTTKEGSADECLAACGAQMSPDCEGEVTGRCADRCDGRCDLPSGAQCMGECSGTCSGVCESQFQGTCGGVCKGKCNGRKIDGECKGTCVGRCDKNAKGSCGGACTGHCDAACSIEAAGICDGACAGECSSKLKDPLCHGSYILPESEGACETGCDALLMTQLQCAKQTVDVKVKGPRNVAAAKALEEAITKFAPDLVIARYEVLNYDRVGRAAVHAQEAVAVMNKAMKSSKTKPSKMAKSCVKAATKAVTPIDPALPSISLAGDAVVAAITGE